MTKRYRNILLVVIFIVLLVLLIGYANRPKPVAVLIAQVEKGLVQDTVTNTRAGTLKACRRASLSPSIGGQIAQLPVHEGDRVVTGQVLLEMWNVDLRAQVELAKSESQASKARSREACVRAAVAKREANRLIKLRKKGLASDESTDQAIGQADATEASCEAAKSSEKISQASVAVAQAALAKTQLLAPFDGTVAEINGELGEFVTPSPIGVPTPPAVDLIDHGCLYVSAPIDEVDAPGIKPQMDASISLDAFKQREFKGKVRRIAPYVLDREKQARTVDIEVDFILDDDQLNMLPGYSADVEVILATSDQTLRIPTEALLEGHRVFVYDSTTETISSKTIKTGLTNWQYTEVLEGLTEGQQIVTSIDREGVVDQAQVSIESPKP